jgi:hypothetical protein
MTLTGLPIGSSPGQMVRAARSLTSTALRRAGAVGVGEARPRSSGTRMTAGQSG